MKYSLYSQMKGAEAEAAFEELANQSGGMKRRTSTERDLHDRIARLEQDLKHREMTVKDLRVGILIETFCLLHCTYPLCSVM